MNKWNQFKKDGFFSIKNQLISVFILILLIPVVVTGVYLTTEIRQSLVQSRTKDIRTDNDRIENDLVNSLTPIVRVADWIYQDDSLTELVTHEYESVYEVYLAYKEYELFDDYLRYYPDIQHIRYYVNNPTLTDSTGVYYADESIINSNWYQHAVEKMGEIHWSQSIDPVTGNEYFTLIRAVYSDYRLIGVVQIAVSDNVFEKILEDSISTVFINLGNHNPIYSYPQFQDIEEGYKKYNEEIDQVIENQLNSSNRELEQEDITFNIKTVNIPKSPQENINIISVIPTDVIVEEVNQDLLTAYISIFLIFILCFILLLAFTRSFNNRIDTLKNSMSKVAKGDFDIPEVITGNDELTEVYSHLITTMNSLEKLISDNYKHVLLEKNMQIRQRETQFKALSSQINPHFLYNTLEMIRMKALKNKDKEVANIIKILSQLMRKALEGNTQIQSISDELEFTKKYLEIQQLRFGENRIHYEIKDNTNKDYLIIPLVIQPIVENSFVHGIELKEDNGLIIIVVDELKNSLCIEVKDNGLGIRKEKLEKLRKIINEEEDSDRIGLNNVTQRIKYAYGKDYGLTIESVEGEGTIVKVFIPKIESKPKEELDA
jgi:two-component system sensor histidine kinase YesM